MFLRSRSVILLYHRVTRLATDPWKMCVTPEHFSEHLQVLRKYSVVRLNQLQDKLNTQSKFLGGLTVAITFDDGYADNLAQAAPLLERFEVPCTFFITSGYVGSDREFWWDELERMVWSYDTTPQKRSQLYRSLYDELRFLSHESRRERLDSWGVDSGAAGPARSSHRVLTTEELRHLAANPLFEIGAHTVTHPVLADQPAETQRAEVRNSKQHLEQLLDRPVASFSYPYGGLGHYSAKTVNEVGRAGFLRACTTEAHPVRAGDSPLEWGRLNVTDMDGDQFEKFLLA